MNERRADELLEGGNTGAEVVRVGDTVRRPARPWSKSVDALLLHLENVGYDAAPRALGYDELGRQVLSFVPGDVDANPSDLTNGDLTRISRSIRELHDATASFVTPDGATWNVAIRPDEERLICHNDLAPWNLVRGADAFVFIDWDGAGPASRTWDLAYAAHGFVPLSPRSGLSEADVTQRLASLLNGYGLDDAGRVAVLSALAARTLSMYSLLEESHRSGAQPWARLYGEGHADVWHEDYVFIQERVRRWHDALR